MVDMNGLGASGSPLAIKKASRKESRLRLAIDGPAGSGKTHSALLIAGGLSEKGICLIDTEEGSAELEAGKPGIPEFNTLPLGAPYSPERYVDAINMASQDHDVIIIDSLSHAWVGHGGILEIHDIASRANLTRNGKEAGFQAWRIVTPQHNRLVDAILSCRSHVIVTMRAKTAYDLSDGKVRKVGMAPIQRDGIEHEFTLVFDLGYDHVAVSGKDRTSLFDGKPHVPSRETGERLRNWLSGGSLVDLFVVDVTSLSSVDEIKKWWALHSSQINAMSKADCSAVKEAVKRATDAVAEATNE